MRLTFVQWLDAVGSIIPFLADALPSLRKDAAAALGEIADPCARDALAARARDGTLTFARRSTGRSAGGQATI